MKEVENGDMYMDTYENIVYEDCDDEDSRIKEYLKFSAEELERMVEEGERKELRKLLSKAFKETNYNIGTILKMVDPIPLLPGVHQSIYMRELMNIIRSATDEESAFLCSQEIAKRLYKT